MSKYSLSLGYVTEYSDELANTLSEHVKLWDTEKDCLQEAKPYYHQVKSMKAVRAKVRDVIFALAEYHEYTGKFRSAKFVFVSSTPDDPRDMPTIVRFIAEPIGDRSVIVRIIVNGMEADDNKQAYRLIGQAIGSLK